MQCNPNVSQRPFGTATSLSIKGRQGKVDDYLISMPELSDANAVNLSLQIDTLIAPAMPIRLIRPTAAAAHSQLSAPNGVTWGISAIGADLSTLDGDGVRIGIIDTGIDSSHACFKGVNFEQIDYTGEGLQDTDGHGTHCAAKIFGRDVSNVRVGVARGVTEVFVGKAIGEDGGDSTMLIQTINDAVAYGCNVISMSLGFDYPSLAKHIHENGKLPLEVATAIALFKYLSNIRLFDKLVAALAARPQGGQHEVLPIAASGNESKRNISFAHEMPAAPPSEVDEFISVGAVQRNSNGQMSIAPFSNVNCLLSAPGVDVLSAKASTTSDLIEMSGTSMAAPHVAGVAAMHVQAARTGITSPSPYQGRH